MKRFWLPNQKGTEIWPRQTVMPAKLVVDGVRTGSPLYQAIAARFGGRLKQFHAGAQQQYALSPNEVMRLQHEWGDGRARYTNIQGQEILQLEVDHKTIAEEQERLKQPWDWAIIELHVPLTGSATHVRCKANRLIPQPIEVGITNDGYVFDSVAFPDNTDGLAPPVMKYPPVDKVDNSATASDNVQISSLAVDLRRFTGAPVTIDLYAILDVGSEPVPSLYHAGDMIHIDGSSTSTFLGHTQVDTSTNTFLSADKPSTLWPFEGASFVPGEGWPGINPFTNGDSVAAADAPRAPVAMVANAFSSYFGDMHQGRNFGDMVYDPASGIVVSFTDYALNNQNGHGTPNTSLWDEDWYMLTNLYSRQVFVDYDAIPIPATCAGEVKVTGGFGSVDWKTVEITNAVTSFDRFGVGVDRFLQTATIAKDIPISGGPDTDYQNLGRVTIFPQQYTAGFESAQ